MFLSWVHVLRPGALDVRQLLYVRNAVKCIVTRVLVLGMVRLERSQRLSILAKHMRLQMLQRLLVLFTGLLNLYGLLLLLFHLPLLLLHLVLR